MMFLSVQGREYKVASSGIILPPILAVPVPPQPGLEVHNQIFREIAAFNPLCLAGALYLNQLLHIWKGFLIHYKIRMCVGQLLIVSRIICERRVWKDYY